MFKKLICRLFGHDYHKVGRNLLVCFRCRKMIFTDNYLNEQKR